MSLKDKLKKKNDPKDGSWDHDMCGKEPKGSLKDQRRGSSKEGKQRSRSPSNVRNIVMAVVWEEQTIIF